MVLSRARVLPLPGPDEPAAPAPRTPRSARPRMHNITGPSIRVDEVSGKGRGVFAVRRIHKGELIERAPVLVIPAAQVAAVTTTLLDDPGAAARAAAATAPVAGAWSRAARQGLTDPALHAAARACLAAACDAVPGGLRPEVEALAELVDGGTSPGDALLRAARAGGPTAALLAAVEVPA